MLVLSRRRPGRFSQDVEQRGDLLMESRGTVGWVAFETIRRLGIRHVFCVPGESYLSLLDAFHESDDVRLVPTRHEEGAGLMAEATAKATGKPGVVLVTRGPGVTHLSIALHTAQQDSTPLVAFVGQVPGSVRHREGFQEMDLVAFARPMTKWAVELTEPERAPELIAEAFTRASSGRPGPVLVSIPEDVDRTHIEAGPVVPHSHNPPSPNLASIAEAAGVLGEEGSVAIITGLGVIRAGASDLVAELAEQIGAVVYTGWRRFDAFPNHHPHYTGYLPFIPPVLLKPIRAARTVLALGTRLGEFTTAGYQVPSPEQRLVQVDLSPDSLHQKAVGVVGDVGAASSALIDATRHLKGSKLQTSRLEGVAAARRMWESAGTPMLGLSRAGAIDPTGVMYHVNAMADPLSATTSDAGISAGWMRRYYKWPGPGTFFGPTAGGMGYSVPAAIGVKLSRPEHPVIAFAGDGAFAMTMSEVATAVALGLSPLVFLVFNNRGLGTIRRHQDIVFDGRRVGTDLGDVDFAAIARGMGALGMRVETEEDFAAAFAEALAADRPAVVDILMGEDLFDPWAGFGPDEEEGAQ